MKKKIAPVIITIVVSLLIILWACTGLAETGGPCSVFPSALLLFSCRGPGALAFLVPVPFSSLRGLAQKMGAALKNFIACIYMLFGFLKFRQHCLANSECSTFHLA